MGFSFNTFTSLTFGFVLLMIYILVLTFQRRVAEITLMEVSKVFFASTSIINGINLIYSTILLLNDQFMELDKMYTVYAGFCLTWISVDELREKINRAKNF